jgi:uncharacterized protein YndB with AHSA1/START domain
MTDTTAASETTLRMERTFRAPAHAVFDAWTNPEVLRRWFAAGHHWDTPRADVDLRVGGRYRITMRSADGEHTVGGEYTEVSPPTRLAFTWAWETEDDANSPGEQSLVELDFREDGGATTVVLVHSGLSGEESQQQHAHGWGECLDNLGRRVLEAE